MVLALEKSMNQEYVDFRNVDLHRRIALVLRKEPGLVRVFAERLRSKLAAARCAGTLSDDVWEWYIILTLWSPLQVIRLLEDSSERAVRLRQNSPFVSLWSAPEQRGTGLESDEGLTNSFRPLRCHSAESGSSNSTRSLTLSADIVTNNPNKKPKPDRPVNGLACWCSKDAIAQIAAKMAQRTVLYFTIVVRVLFALLVLVSVISCSIRISPFTI